MTKSKGSGAHRCWESPSGTDTSFRSQSLSRTQRLFYESRFKERNAIHWARNANRINKCLFIWKAPGQWFNQRNQPQQATGQEEGQPGSTSQLQSSTLCWGVTRYICRVIFPILILAVSVSFPSDAMLWFIQLVYWGIIWCFPRTL